MDAKSDSAVINSDTIAKMLSEDALVEIDLHEAKANDMGCLFRQRESDARRYLG